MKAKIKRHSRSALSVLLSLCMLVSCVTVGMIGTDAAQTLDAVGASADEASVGADLDKAEDSVGAEADGESVGSGSGYFLMGRNDDYTRFSDTGVTVTKSGSKYTAFIPKDTGSTWSTNSNFFIMLSSSASYTNGFYQNESITVTKSGDEINFYGSQSRDSYRFARFSFGSLTDVSGVEVTVSNKTYTIKVRKSTTTNYSVRVSAGANGSVLAGTNTISAGNFEDETIAAGASLTLTANPATGYSFKSWDVTGGATVASTTSASTTLSATDDGTVTATYVKNATATRRIYFDNSTANWLTPYAYAKKDGYPVLGSAPGTAMTYDHTDGVWYIDVDADATEIQFSNNGSGTSLLRNNIPSYNNPEFYNYNPSYTASGSWRKHEAKTLPNEVNASLDPTSITNNPDIYSNIKATFFDYFTDHEVGGSWYSSIVANSDAWIDTDNSPKPDSEKASYYWTTINRNPYQALNKALSVYANKNSVKYPIYFGAFNEGGYQNPGYYRSARMVYGHIINDSNQLGSTSDGNRWFRALPGLVGNSISDGSVHHVTTGGNNGAPMVLFDKEWLNTRTAPNNNSYKTNRIYFDPGDLWSGANANFRILQKDTGDWWDGSKLNYDSTQGIYYKDIVGSTTKIKFVRCDPRLNDGTFKIDKTNGTLLWSDSSLDCDYAWAYQEYNVDSSTRTGHLFRIKWENWTDKKYCDIINYYGNYSEYITNQKLGQVVNSSFPVVKRTTNNGNVDYYEFNSNGATDNVWFEGLTGGSPVLHYGSGTDYGVKNGYNDGYGFFPFDKNSDNSGYGKDLAFGMKLEIPFTLGPNGQIQGRDKNYYDQKFYFSGDDDLWVYVDGNLVLDLGGDHKMSEAEINFASRTISTTRTPNSTLTSDLGITRNGSFASWFNNDDTTKVHTMTIYYMERGMQESNLKFGFSFAPVDNKFIATEEIKLDGVNPALLSDVEEVAGGDKILVTHKAEAGNDNPTALATYKDYKHSDGNPGNTGSDGTYILANNDSATFIKQFNDGGTNENTDPADYFNLVCSDAPGNVFSYHTVVSKVTDLTMDHMIPTLRANPNIFKFRTTKNPKTGLDPTDIQADLLSTISTKSLIITKDILGVPEDTTNTFDITVEIDVDGDGTTYGYKKYALPYTLNGTAGTMTAGVSKVTIKKDDLVVITGIPEKAKIRLYETDPADTYEYYDTHIFDEDDEEQTTAIGKTAYAPSGYHGVEFKLISDDFVFVTNRPLPTYSITAQKDTNAPDTTSSFDFYIMKTTALSGTATLTPYTGDYEKISADRTTTTSGTLDASDGGKISLKSGEQFIISGLSQNDKYLVYESDPTPYSYSSTSTDFSSDETSYHVIDPTINSTKYKGVSLTIPNHDVNITISNERYYNITVTKALEGGGSSTEYFPIYVQYKYAGGGDSYQQIEDGEYGILDSFFSTPETIPTSPTGSPDWYFDGTKDCFMLKAGKSFTLTGINNGDQFIVAEDIGNITGYTYTSTSASNGTGTGYTSGNRRGLQNITIADSDVTVTITNAVVIPTYTLKLTKTTDSVYDYTTAFKVRVQKWNGTEYVDLYTGGNESTPYYGLSGDDHNGNAVTRNALPYSTGSSTQFYYYPVHKGDVLDIPDIIDGDQIRVIEVDPDTSYYNYGSTTLSNVTNATTRSAYNTAGVGKGIDFTFDADDVTSGENLTVTINNVSVKQTVRVYKRTNFNINDGSTFQIHVKWLPYNKGGSYINKEGGVINTDAHVTSTSTTVPTIEAEGKYSLQKDEYVVFTNVPYGSTFQVEETAYGDSNVTQEQRFTFDKLVVDGHEYTENVSLQTFEITKDTNFFVWNKIFKNDVKIKKIINGRAVGETHDTETEHTFSIGILRNGQGSASYNTTDDSVTYYITNAAGTEGSGVTVTEFPFTVTLKEDEEVRLHGIYSGSFFTVRETSVGFGYQYNSIEFTNVVDNDPAIEGLPNPTIDSSARSITFQTRNLGLTGSAGILFKNEKRPTIKYRITYNYPSRTQFIPTKTKLYGDQQYFVEDTISGDDENYDTYFANGNITKALVQAVAPFETNFMIDLSLNPDNITIGSPVTSGGETIYYATATFTGGETTRKHVNFKLPYNYTVENHTYGKKLFQATNQNYLGDDVDNWSETDSEYPYGVPYQDDMTAWEIETYVDTDGKTKERKVYFFTEAPSTLNNNGTTMNFLYWSVRSINESTGQYEEVARCYDARFNYVIFDDYEITPVYDGFDSALGYDTSGNTQSTSAQFTTINLLAFSRNQWNSNVWTDSEVNGNGTLSTPLDGRDTVYVDFDVAFEYNNIKLKNHKTIKTGILIENCGKLDVENHPLNFNDNDAIVSDGKTNYQLDYEYYADKYSANKTAMEAQIKEYLKGNIDADAYKTYVEGLYGSDFTDDMYNGSFEMLKTYNTNGSINNMNRSEIGIGNHVRYITDEGTDIVGDWTIDEVKKNSVFRAYTYIKDAENNIILSEPVYFTVYNTAVLGGQV